jgi:hypothetical protein
MVLLLTVYYISALVGTVGRMRSHCLPQAALTADRVVIASLECEADCDLQLDGTGLYQRDKKLST